MDNRLFVGNLSFNTSESDLQAAFAAHGSVIEANLVMDRVTGRPRGFGFITMSSPEEAQKAVEAMNGTSVNGRALTVNIARPREERSGGGGGGGDRRSDRGGSNRYLFFVSNCFEARARRASFPFVGRLRARRRIKACLPP